MARYAQRATVAAMTTPNATTKPETNGEAPPAEDVATPRDYADALHDVVDVCERIASKNGDPRLLLEQVLALYPKTPKPPASSGNRRRSS